MNIAALLSGGLQVPGCPVCAERRRAKGYTTPALAETMALGTLVCAECAEQLAAGLAALPAILADKVTP